MRAAGSSGYGNKIAIDYSGMIPLRAQMHPDNLACAASDQVTGGT